MRRRSHLLWLFLFGVAAATTAAPALADGSSTSTADEKKAQDHFQRAKDLYHAGSYREARDELEIVHKLDPKAKDPVMNLAIVCEKLSKYDEAITWLKTYLAMDGVTAAEQTRAQQAIKRIEGAKAKAPPPDPTPTTAPPQSPPQHTGPPPEPAKGRVDGATIAAGSIAAVGILAGIGLGVYALSQRPTDFVTGRDGSYANLEEKTDDAHTMAIVADVSLAVGVVAALATAWLYFGRPKDASVNVNAGTARFRLAPVRSGGGAMFFGGTF